MKNSKVRRRHCGGGRYRHALRRTRLACEALESRRMLAAVAWDGNSDGDGDNVNWSDPLNWSGNALPGSADDVTISVPGTITVTHASGNTTIRSVTSDENLTISGGIFTVTAGASTASGSLTIAAAQLNVNNAGTTFTASGATSIDHSTLAASAGGQLNLPNATSYAERPNNTTFFHATGVGSAVNLPALTTITGTTGALIVNALAGGTLDMHSVGALTARAIQVKADGAGSTVNLSGVSTWNDVTSVGTIDIRNGGTLTVSPLLSVLDRVDLTLGPGAWTFPISQIASITKGRVDLLGTSASFNNLTNIDESTMVATTSGGVGSVLSLPVVTTYAEFPGNTTFFHATGVGSAVNLPALTTITGTTGALAVNALAGATVDMHSVGALTARGILVTADGAGSTVNLSGVSTWNDVTSVGTIDIRNGGTLTVSPLLSVLDRVDLTLGPGAWTFPISQIASITKGRVDLLGTSASFNNLTNIDESTMVATTSGGVGSVLSLPVVTTYAEFPGNTTFFHATGVGSAVNLPALTTITGTTGALVVNALAGATVDMHSVGALTARGILVTADGAGSTVNLSGVSTWNDVTSVGTIDIRNGGTLTVSPLLSVLDRVDLTLGPGAWTFPISQIASITKGRVDLLGTSASFNNLTNIDESTMVATTSGGVGSVLSLPVVTTYAEFPGNTTFFHATGVGSAVNLPALTTITGTTGALAVNALAGATVDMHSVGALTARGILVTADGAGSTVNLSGVSTWNDVTNVGTIAVRNGGTLTVSPLLSALDRVELTLGPGTWTFPTNQITSFFRRSINLNGTSASFNSLTSVDESTLVATTTGGVGSVLSLPVVATYAEFPGNTTFFQANGVGSAVNLPALTTITGTTGALVVNALAGGTIDLHSVGALAARGIQVTANGAGSMIDLSGVSDWNDPSPNVSFVTSASSGTVNLHPTLSILTNVDVRAASGAINAGTIDLRGGSQLSRSGSINADIINGGTVTPLTPPSTPPGSITIVGDYTQTAAGSFVVEVTGTTPGTGFDRLVVQGGVTLAGEFVPSSTIAVPGPPLGTELIIIDNDGTADPVVGTFAGLPNGSLWVLNSVPYEVRYAAGDGNDVALVRVPNRVAERRTYYNNSAWDGNNVLANATDDAAIATDKSALLPGGTGTFANYTSFSKGVNGIVVDIANLPTGTAAVGDFAFKTGNVNNTATWTPLAVVPTVTVRLGGGLRGSDRVTFTWPDDTIKKTWLQVTVLATANTDLAAADVFYFGNAVGEAGDTTSNALVNATDEIQARANPRNVVNPAPIDFKYDYNRDKLVNATDQIIARSNTTNVVTALRLIVPAPAAGALVDAAIVEAAEESGEMLARRRRK